VDLCEVLTNSRDASARSQAAEQINELLTFNSLIAARSLAVTPTTFDFFPWLYRAITDKDPGVRRMVARNLGDLGTNIVVDPLIRLFGDPDPEVRSEAATAFHKMRDPRAVQSLIALLKDEYAGVRRHALLALGSIGDTRAVEPICDQLSDDSPLQESGLFNNKKGVREQAAHALGELRDHRAVEPLLLLLNDPSLRQAGLKSLAKFDEPRANAAVLAAKQEEQREAEAELRVKEAKERELAAPATEMSDSDMVNTLCRLCDAYMTSDRQVITSLEPLATSIGHALNRRGGVVEMLRIFHLLDGRWGSRTIDMLWDGIGNWRG